MTAERPRIAIPEPHSANPEYNQRAWPQYAEAVEAAGCTPVAIPLATPQDALARLVSTCSGILLPGSPADIDPEKYGRERLPATAQSDSAREAADEILIQDAFNLDKPVLAICYGLQSLNTWCGGTLLQDLATSVNHRPGRDVAEAHPVAVAPGSRLAAILAGAGAPHREETRDPRQGRTFMVNSSHHQAVEAAGTPLTVCARCPGDGIIEALELPRGGHFVLGVEWHPERTWKQNPSSRAIFDAFAAAARAWRPRRILTSVAR